MATLDEVRPCQSLVWDARIEPICVAPSIPVGRVVARDGVCRLFSRVLPLPHQEIHRGRPRRCCLDYRECYACVSNESSPFGRGIGRSAALRSPDSLIPLSQHPQVEAKLVEELQDILGDREPMLEDLSRLRYTEMVLKESTTWTARSPWSGRFGTSQPPESLSFSGLFLLHSFRLEAGGHYEYTRHFHIGGHAGTQF